MYTPPIVELKSMRDMVASGIHTTMPEVLKAVLEHGDGEWDAKQLCYSLENMFYVAAAVGLKQARDGDSHFPPALREFVRSHFEDDLELAMHTSTPGNVCRHPAKATLNRHQWNCRQQTVCIPNLSMQLRQSPHPLPLASAAPPTATSPSSHRVVPPPTVALPSHHHIGHHPAQSLAERTRQEEPAVLPADIVLLLEHAKRETVQTEEALKQERNEIAKREATLKSWRVKLAEEEARRKSCRQPSTSHLTSPDRLPPVLPHDLPPNLPESFINYLKKIWLSMDVIQEDLDFETRVTELCMQHLYDTVDLLSDEDSVV
ncbi:hypothetical protein B0H21DRAFT_712168 [Amylocystis lapponica]|nr:hypothetical protein B0H21DRAFT_712168 [Amylocystis lapponica]